jgi:glyoxylase-like metal-dependent hydrolase (beta-lactamase superfamily II)
MDTCIDEIAAGVYRISTYVPEADFMFNQFLLDGEEPLLFHTGPRRMFPLTSQALARVRPVEDLRWITFGHLEADECGGMNVFLAAAPQAQIAHGRVGCMVSIDDLADRPPRPLDDGDVLDIGGHRVRYLATPHVPHAWDAGVHLDESTGTLLCGDLFTAVGNRAPLVESERLGPAMAAEDISSATSLTPRTGETLRPLADLTPSTLSLMHGPSFTGNGTEQLTELARQYDQRLQREGETYRAPVQRPEAAKIA